MNIIRDEKKNEYIKSRPGWWGVGFEEIEEAIKWWYVWFNWENESKKYIWQQVMIVAVWQQIFKVPYNKEWDHIKLITAFPTPKYNHIFNK